jgi:serine/threonine protein kinase
MIGKTVSHFRIVARVGEGKSGTIYRARDEKLRREVALRVLPADLVDSPEKRRQILSEARAAAALNHPNLGKIYEIGEESGSVFIAGEWIEGKTIPAVLQGRPLPAPDLLRYGTEIADAMARAHSAGVIHRNLKP